LRERICQGYLSGLSVAARVELRDDGEKASRRNRMRFSTLTPIASAVLASVLTAGCAGNGSPAGGAFAPTVSGAARSFGHARPLPGTEILRHAVASLRGYVEPHVDRSIAVAPGRSRQTGAQVYVSDIGTNLVLGFAQPGTVPTLLLAGFRIPQGLATDASGNLYVANTGALNIQVFAPGATSPFLTIDEPNDLPLGVAIDKSGNIWASNIINDSDGPGSVVEYSSSGTLEQTISCPALQKYYFIAVDGSGNVFVDGFADLSNHNPSVQEIPAGTSTCVTLPPLIAAPGGLATTASGDLVVDDQEGFTKTYAAPTFKRTLHKIVFDGVIDPVTIALQAGETSIWSADANPQYTATQFAYPAGGSSTSALRDLSDPIGIAVYPPNH
jgi:hypothetical protein